MLPPERRCPATLQVDDVTARRLEHDFVAAVTVVGHGEERLRDGRVFHFRVERLPSLVVKWITCSPILGIISFPA
eukprot:6833595-Heterocapsa_arctica.AAC.1